MFLLSRGDETGIHRGLKIPRPQGHVGSTPTPGTIFTTAVGVEESRDGNGRRFNDRRTDIPRERRVVDRSDELSEERRRQLPPPAVLSRLAWVQGLSHREDTRWLATEGRLAQLVRAFP